MKEQTPTSDHFPKDPIRVAYVRRAHGIAGAVKLELLGGDPDRLSKGTMLWREDTCTAIHVGTLRRLPDEDILVTFVEIPDRNGAEQLRGAYLVVDETAHRSLAKNEWFIHDLVGVQVELENGRSMGTVKDIESYVANDVLVVETSDGTIDRYPMVHASIARVDLTHKRILLKNWCGNAAVDADEQ